MRSLIDYMHLWCPILFFFLHYLLLKYTRFIDFLLVATNVNGILPMTALVISLDWDTPMFIVSFFRLTGTDSIA